MAKFDVNVFIAYLKSKWGETLRCPMCTNTEWDVQESTYELREWNPHTLVSTGPVLPLIPVVCTNCGNTILVNAIAAGIVAPTGAKS